MERSRASRNILVAVSWCLLAGMAATPPPLQAQPQWEYLGLGQHVVRAIKAHDGYLFAGTEHGVFRRARAASGTTWTALGPDSLAVQDLLFLDTSTVLAGGLDSSGTALYRSTDQGLSWTPIATPDLYWEVEDLSINPIYQDTVYAADTKSVLRSVDAGLTWAATAPGGYRWNIVTPSPLTPGRLWAGGEDFFFTARLFRSTDGGVTWIGTLTPSPQGENAVVSLAIDPHDENLMYMGQEGYVSRTVDGGLSWTQVVSTLDTDLYDTYFLDIEIDPRSSSRILATGRKAPPDTNLAIFVSEDYGDTWDVFQHAPGPPGQEAWDLELVEDGHRLEVYLSGTGVYRVDMLSPSTGVSRADIQGPDARLLPVRLLPGAVEVRYAVGSSTFADLSVFDVQGRRIRVLERTAREAGEYRSIWRYTDSAGSKVSRGVYYIRLQTDTTRQALAVLAIFR